MNVITVEKCPTCNGTGEIAASILLSDEIENNLRYTIKDQNEKEVTSNAHPYLAAYFTKGLFSIRYKWWRKYRRWVKVKPVNSYHFTEYHFINGNEEEIKV